MTIEICCSSKASLFNAINGGASRLELCKNLMEDGLTPSLDFMKEALRISPLPVHVLIRPRNGNFIYTSEELKTTAEQIEMAQSFGAHGIVIGALEEDGNLPLAVLKKMAALVKPLDLTFHRAFDQVLAPRESLKKLMDIGFDRVLTSGQQPTAQKGLDLLIQLQKIADGQMTIMPGGGVDVQNCELFFKAGFKEIHLSAKGVEKTATGEPISDLATIKKIVNRSSNYML